MIIFHFLRRSSCTHEQFLSFALQKFLYARTVPFVCFAKGSKTYEISGCPKSYARTVPLRTNIPFVFFAEVFAEVFTEVFAEDCEPMKFRAARSLTHQPSFLFSL
ncbi:hypothetical protein HBI56_146950 [Parastagonospora nodorum]|nr:hypothetical protein HBI77_114530 [Parastagonospora nodorum]KAH5575147.1 hypothetical protein HBI24_189630 [Parastagonospora nodorum]KAH6507882.1 hypothetical protein HBI56_146950 [Parastagonospora nodorum]